MSLSDIKPIDHLAAGRPPVHPHAATFESFSYRGFNPLDHQVGDGQFLNPILPGFYPDPSICRDGNDFYLITSTFAYFPAIPVFHSTDLVHWRQIGNVLDRPSQAAPLKDANTRTGIYAPTICKHGDAFYVVSTFVNEGGNFIVTADRPEGPWSDPIWFSNIPGIDPSLFFDDDGKVFIVHNGDAPAFAPLYEGHRAIRLQQIDFERKTTVGESIVLVNGGTDLAKKPIWIEGPHLFKKDGWYFLCAAEGGTAEQHSQVIFRSRELTGPYEPFSGNPILTQRQLPQDRSNPVTSVGHADLVELPNGEWWAVFLGCRPNEQGLTALARETFLLPVQWREGWPIILEEELPVPLVLDRPALPRGEVTLTQPVAGMFVYEDCFAAPVLDFGWMAYRLPEVDWYRLAGGKLRLSALEPGLSEMSGNPAFLSRRLHHARFEVATVMDLNDTTAGIEAGLVLFRNERRHFFFGVQVRLHQPLAIFVERVSGALEAGTVATRDILASFVLPDAYNRVELKIVEVSGKGTFLYRNPDAGGEWLTAIAAVDTNLLGDGISSGFTGTCVGMHARQALPKVST